MIILFFCLILCGFFLEVSHLSLPLALTENRFSFTKKIPLILSVDPHSLSPSVLSPSTSATVIPIAMRAAPRKISSTKYRTDAITLVDSGACSLGMKWGPCSHGGCGQTGPRWVVVPTSLLGSFSSLFSCKLFDRTDSRLIQTWTNKTFTSSTAPYLRKSWRPLPILKVTYPSLSKAEQFQWEIQFLVNSCVLRFQKRCYSYGLQMVRKQGRRVALQGKNSDSCMGGEHWLHAWS